MGDLDGQVVLVTGAGSGMGRDIARRLAADGANVVLLGRRIEPLRQVEADIALGGGAALSHSLDVTDRDQIEQMLDRVRREFGPVDVLVNNAGSASRVLNPQYTGADEWRGVLEVNLTAVFQLVQAVLPDMLGRSNGTIVTVSSLAAVTPNLLGGAAYGAAKAAVRNFMTFLHTTFRADGIRAITILPGETDTPILDNRARPPRDDERANMLQADDVARAVHLVVAMPQRAVVQELVIAPTRQRDTSHDLEVSRHVGAPHADAAENARSTQ